MSIRDEYLMRRGITPAWADYFGLEFEPSGPGWIKIPYRAGLGIVKGYRFRRLGPGEPKYFQPKGSARHLFNVQDSCRPHVYITEGEFDCIILKQLGLDAVGVAGVNAFMPVWRWLFQGVDVSIAYDGDEEGKRASLELGRMLSHHASDIEVVKIPDGHDVTSLYLAGSLKEVLAA